MASTSISRVERPSQTSLASPDQLEQELATATTPDRALVVRERAKILAHLVRRRGAFVDAWKYHRVRLDAERKTGELLPGDSRGAPLKSQHMTSERTSTGGVPLAGGTATPLPAGITKQAAHVYRTLARVGDTIWDGWNAQFELSLKRLSDDKTAGDVLKEHTTQSRYAMARQLFRDDEVSENLADIATNTLTTVDDNYPVIVIDPPWPMEKIKREVAPDQVGFDYPTLDEAALRDFEIPMSTGELRTLSQIATDDCHLWLWTTHKFLPMAFRLLEAWGFKYVCAFVWHKPGGFQPFGLPQYNCEFALYAHKGNPSFTDTRDFFTCFDAPRGAHSEKPEDFYNVLRRVTAGPRLDVFNRRQIAGFDGWGLEAV